VSTGAQKPQAGEALGSSSSPSTCGGSVFRGRAGQLHYRIGEKVDCTETIQLLGLVVG
jgi:hypothetical protein